MQLKAGLDPDVEDENMEDEPAMDVYGVPTDGEFQPPKQITAGPKQIAASFFDEEDRAAAIVEEESSRLARICAVAQGITIENHKERQDNAASLRPAYEKV